MRQETIKVGSIYYKRIRKQEARKLFINGETILLAEKQTRIDAKYPTYQPHSYAADTTHKTGLEPGRTFDHIVADFARIKCRGGADNYLVFYKDREIEKP